MPPEIAKLGHVALVTPDIDKSLWFFRDVIGLEEVDRRDDTVFLRAWGDWEHHTLSLRAGDSSTIDHIAWRTKRPEDVQLFARQFEQAGTTVRHVAAGTEAGQGAAIRWELPSGHTFELYYDMDKTAAPADRKSRLKNQPTRAWDHGVSPRRIDHVNINVPNPPQIHEWLGTQMGFKVREQIRLNNGFVPAAWMSVTPLVHDIAVMADGQGRPGRFHHVAYFLDNWQDVMRAADILREHGVAINVGPGRHGISQALFLYAKDPGSGHRIELFSGGYLIFDPDWETIEWREDELAEGIIWWGPALAPDFLEDSTGPQPAVTGPGGAPVVSAKSAS